LVGKQEVKLIYKGSC